MYTLNAFAFINCLPIALYVETSDLKVWTRGAPSIAGNAPNKNRNTEVTQLVTQLPSRGPRSGDRTPSRVTEFKIK